MTDAFSAVCFSKEDAHDAAIKAYSHAQALLAGGQHALIECKPSELPITIKQRGFLHAAVLTQISEQVRVNGQRYTIDVWKSFFKSLFIPREYEMRADPRWDAKLSRLVQPKRKTPHLVNRSTEELGVRAYAEFTEKIIQHAVVEHGVDFVFTREEQELRAYKPRRKERDGT